MNPAIKAIIIDDEKFNADLLHFELTSHFPEVEIIKVCYNAKEGLKAVKELEPDLLFLDIEMPVMNGFEILELSPNVDFHVIFTTAHSEYALQAIKTSAVDYLLKPISRSDLEQALKSYKTRTQTRSSQIDFLLNQLQDIRQSKISKIALPTPDGLIFMYIDNLLYFQSDDVYTFAVTDGNKKIFLNKTMKTIEDMIRGLGFFRIHRSYIINLSKIKKFVKADGGYLQMENDDHIPIARSRRDEFFKKLDEI